MKGFYECLMGKFASNMTVPFHCVPEFLGTSNDGKLFLDKTSHVYQVTGLTNFVLQKVQWKKTEEQDVKKEKSVELHGVENEELDDEPTCKEKDATFADDGAPWTKSESHSQLKSSYKNQSSQAVNYKSKSPESLSCIFKIRFMALKRYQLL